MKITKSGHKKRRLIVKNDKRKIDEESLQLHLRKTTKKRMNQIGNFEELECEKSLNISKS